MKKDSESLSQTDWQRKGSLDIRRADILIANDDPAGAAFHLQQALEKYLKGYLIGKGWQLKRIHDLEELLDYAVDFNESLESYRPLCQEVTEYYLEERYPFLISSDLTNEEVRLRIIQVKDFIQKLG